MASNLQHAKKLLRKTLKLKGKQMSNSERERESQSVIQRLVESKYFQESQRISVYLPMSDEINTLPLVKHIFERNKACFIPKYVGDTMEMVRLDSFDEIECLPLTPWNIRQPADDEDMHRHPNREDALKSGGLDLIIVPGLGFTRDGSRIGRGKGYYDTYIQRCIDAEWKTPHLVALAFQRQMCQEIPTNELDRPLDCVMYEGMTEESRETAQVTA